MMIKRKIVLFITVLLSLLGSGCSLRTMTLKHYVNSYALEMYDSNRAYTVVEDNDIEGLIRVMMQPKKWVSWTNNCTEAEKAVYMSYARQNNDLDWNREVIENDETHIKAIWFDFPAHQVVDITVTAESNWDEQTPAGSSLDDKFIFISGSPDQYIKNGYNIDRSKFEEVKNGASPKVQRVLDTYTYETLYTMLPICGTLSDINFENYQLMGFGQLWFALMPIDKLSSGAKINIQVRFESGKVVNYKHTCQ